MERFRYVLRDEIFGGTLFDRKLLKHKFLRPEEIQAGIIIDGQRLREHEHWVADTKGLPQNIPFSPTRVYFEVTTSCNLRCATCFNSSGPKPLNEMNTIEVIRCLNGMRKDHVFDIRFSGGEATTRANWFEEIKHARDIGLAVSLNTNGVYKDPETVDKLAELKIDQVTVSIDGTQEHHDVNRGMGTYQKALNTLAALHKSGVVLRTNTVLTGLSIKDAEDVIRSVGPYVEEMAFFHMRMIGRAQGIQDRMVGFKELHQFKLEMDELQKSYPNIRFYFWERAIQENSIMPNDLKLQIGSPDGLTRLNLLADGSLYAGGYTAYIDQHWRLGSLQEEDYSLLDIWRNSPVLGNYRNFGKGFLKRCLECPELDNRCPGVNVEMELIRNLFPGIGNPNCIY